MLQVCITKLSQNRLHEVHLKAVTNRICKSG